MFLRSLQGTSLLTPIVCNKLIYPTNLIKNTLTEFIVLKTQFYFITFNHLQYIIFIVGSNGTNESNYPPNTTWDTDGLKCPYILPNHQTF